MSKTWTLVRAGLGYPSAEYQGISDLLTAGKILAEGEELNLGSSEELSNLCPLTNAEMGNRFKRNFQQCANVKKSAKDDTPEVIGSQCVTSNELKSIRDKITSYGELVLRAP